eukprot:GFUD01042322.1.p1 GENE.GFUD01042322.1~~GFUD01042322.1.p1  ORF type:complete len:198 (+),score=65.20 GFUD01042322.1:42-635(+)
MSENRQKATNSGEQVKKMKTEVTNCFGQHLVKEKIEVQKKNPHAKVDFPKALQKWNEQTPEVEKAELKLLSKQEKFEMGDNYRKKENTKSSEVKESEAAAVKEYDCERRRKERLDLKLKKENEKYCSQKFKAILAKAEGKFETLVKENAILEKEYLDLTSENSELVQMLGEEGKSEDSWKSKYKALFEEHKLCKKTV